MSPTETLADQTERLGALEAFELSITAGLDDGLEAIGSPKTPRTVRARLALLVQHNQYSDAVASIQDLEPHELWWDLAVFAQAGNGDFDAARTLAERADSASDVSVMRRCRLAYAEGVFEWLRRHRPKLTLLTHAPLSEDDSRLLSTIIEVLEPLVWSVRANRRVQGELDSNSLIWTIHATYLIGDLSPIQELASWLIKVQPLPLAVAELVLKRLLAAPKDLVTRLRAEHPTSFSAHVLAALIERDLLKQFEDALTSLLGVSELASTELEKESLAVAIFETSGHCDSAGIDRAIEVVGKLLPCDSRIVPLLRAIRLMALRDVEKARLAFEVLRKDDDGVWWQGWAQVCEAGGHFAEAQVAWERAGALIPHPDVLRRSAQSAIEQKNFQTAIKALTQLVEESPNDARSLERLAFSLIRTGNLAGAVPYLGRLVAIEPKVKSHRLNQASCLARTNQAKEAAAALEPLCDGDEQDSDAIQMRSELLASLGNLELAFELVDRIAADNWDNPKFLLSYINLSYRANREASAHDAFLRLLQLKNESKVPADLLQSGTLEQLLDYGKEYHKRRAFLFEEVVHGRVPWLLADDWLNNAACWALQLRTQDLAWLSEDRLARAAYTVYSTNGFSVVKANGVPTLQAISAAPTGSVIVADLSALMTLHRLGRLHQALNYFGTILLPASYGELRIRDAQRLGSHQPSRELELRIIRDAIEESNITVAAESVSAVPICDEYSDDANDHSFRLRDLHSALLALQKLSTQESTDLLAKAHKPQISTASQSFPTPGGEIRFGLETLRTLANLKVFPTILSTFRVRLTDEERQEIVAELRAHRLAADTLAWHHALWEDIHKLGHKCEFRHVPKKDDAATDDEERGLQSPHFDSIQLAEQSGAPLLVDDRVCQVAVLKMNDACTFRSFGSDKVLEAMRDAGISDIADEAGDILKLLGWRYRFVVPRSEVLTHWARNGRDCLPGPELLSASAYLHECLRDPGLFTGPEQSQPPLPMAVRFVTSWIDAITGMLATIWADSSYSQAAKRTLTRWVGEELIPSCPRGLWYQAIGNTVGQSLSNTTLQMAMVKFTTVPGFSLANEGLRVLAESLGIDEQGFLNLAAELIHVLNRR